MKAMKTCRHVKTRAKDTIVNVKCRIYVKLEIKYLMQLGELTFAAKVSMVPVHLWLPEAQNYTILGKIGI